LVVINADVMVSFFFKLSSIWYRWNK
jgi:hypothetical protein